MEILKDTFMFYSNTHPVITGIVSGVILVAVKWTIEIIYEF